MNKFELYCNNYPLITEKINGGNFSYRYFKNDNSTETLVLLVGGIGMSDLIYTHFEKFAKHYSVLTFDYHIDFKTNEQLTAAIAKLLKKLNIKAWFVGQSLGGFVAQLMAQKYPEVTKGLVLSNTGCLSADMSSEAYASLTAMLKRTNKTKIMLKFLPLSIFKKQISSAVFKKYAADFSESERHLLRELCDITEEKLTKKYELHMLNLLIDMESHNGMKKEEFEYLNNKVLLMLSDDDTTFTDGVKHELIALMPNPTTVTDLKGGHLALMVNCDKYVDIITVILISASFSLRYTQNST